MSLRDSILYTKDHEWLSASNGTVEVGVTDYAVEQLGDIVHIELPEVGTTIQGGDAFGTIESTKTVSDLYLPATGKVTEVNQSTLNSPEIVGEDPYGKGWLIKVELEEPASSLLDAASYEAFIKEQDD